MKCSTNTTLTFFLLNIDFVHDSICTLKLLYYRTICGHLLITLIGILSMVLLITGIYLVIFHRIDFIDIFTFRNNKGKFYKKWS